MRNTGSAESQKKLWCRRVSIDTVENDKDRKVRKKEKKRKETRKRTIGMPLPDFVLS